ncbi:MAG TPA: hypothetical protein VJ810_38590 [Blastocatellia bacterium]|nr:hypothetical protein [Blastocatellia bacterium]
MTAELKPITGVRESIEDLSGSVLALSPLHRQAQRDALCGTRRQTSGGEAGLF